MKKVLSLLISATMLIASFATVVSADDTPTITSLNKATVTVALSEVDYDAAHSDIQSVADEWDDAGVDYTIYNLAMTPGNLPQITKSSSNYTGQGLIYLAVGYTVATDGEQDVDFAIKAINGDFATSATATGYSLGYFYQTSNPANKLLKTSSVAAGGSLSGLSKLQIIVKNDIDFTITAVSSQMIFGYFNNASATGKSGSYIVNSPAEITVNEFEEVLASGGGGGATTWDITFDVDGATTVKTFDDGDAVSADGVSTTKAGYNFLGWSETDGGAVVGSLGTASADKTFYAVFELIDTAVYTAIGEDKAGAQGVETITPGTYSDVDGNPVDLSATYKAAKFENVDFNTALKKYRVVLFAGEEKAQMPWINFGSDIEVDTSKVVVIVKETGSHSVTAIKIEEADID